MFSKMLRHAFYKYCDHIGDIFLKKKKTTVLRYILKMHFSCSLQTAQLKGVYEVLNVNICRD
jgi:hypothetical protein